MTRQERLHRDTIDSDPCKAVLLAYADYLDEEDDERGEAIRSLCRSNTLPIARYDGKAWGRYDRWYESYCEALDFWIQKWLEKNNA